MTTPVDDLVGDVAAVAPGVAHPVISRAILNAAQRFCKRGRAWRAFLDVDYPISGFSTLGLAAPNNARVTGLIAVRVNDEDMELAGDELLTEPAIGRRPKQVSLFNEELHFDGQFQGGETMLVLGMLEPTAAAAELPDVLGIGWREALIAGALSEVLRFHGAGRADERRALLHESRFDALVSEARARSRNGWTNARRSVKYGGI